MKFECPECETDVGSKRIAGGDTSTVTIECKWGHRSEWELDPINLKVLGPAFETDD